MEFKNCMLCKSDTLEILEQHQANKECGFHVIESTAINYYADKYLCLNCGHVMEKLSDVELKRYKDNKPKHRI